MRRGVAKRVGKRLVADRKQVAEAEARTPTLRNATPRSAHTYTAVFEIDPRASFSRELSRDNGICRIRDMSESTGEIYTMFLARKT